VSKHRQAVNRSDRWDKAALGGLFEGVGRHAQGSVHEASMEFRGAGSVSHNHFFLYPDAIEASIEIGDWGGVERYVAALEDFTRSESLPWCNFFIARGRALAAWGQGRREAHFVAEIQAPCNEAERVNISSALPALKDALKST
jgi:hypothetical protein